VIIGQKIERPTKSQIASDIAGVLGLQMPAISRGSSVETEFLSEVFARLSGVPNIGTLAYRQVENIFDLLGLTYDPYWDTSESAESGGGGTVTTRAYSRMLAAIRRRPRCFLLSVNDAPVGTRWESNFKEVYRYDRSVSAHRPLNEAGPGSQVVFYATGKSTISPKHFIASATVAYIYPGWEGPWEAHFVQFESFPNPVPVSELRLDGWNRQHAITEISWSTFQALQSSGGTIIAGTDSQDSIHDQESENETAADVLRRLRSDYPSGNATSLFVPERLPRGTIKSSAPATRQYSEALESEAVHAANMVSQSGDPRRNKIAELRAVDLARGSLVTGGWSLIADRQRDGVGYDLEFSLGARTLHVEIKGIQGSDLIFNLTPKELWRAETDESWVLVAVTSVLSPMDYKIQLLTRDAIANATKTITGYRVYSD